MTNRSQRDGQLGGAFWPEVDARLGHVRTPLGTVIPFPVIRTVVAIVAVVLGLEVTFGLTNWITIPAFVLTGAWALHACDEASVRYAHDIVPEDLDGEQP
ncbi:MAG: hypothetical protein AAGA65_10350 [Actinomycetota bacterium]